MKEDKVPKFLLSSINGLIFQNKKDYRNIYLEPESAAEDKLKI